MSRLFLLRPQYACERALATESANIESRNCEPTTDHVTVLAEKLSGWSGDELFDSIRGTVITASLALRLSEADVSGLSLSEVILARSSDNEPPTAFTKIEPLGFVLMDAEFRIQSWSGHDICATPKAELIVSEKALSVLRGAKLSNCHVTPLSGVI